VPEQHTAARYSAGRDAVCQIRLRRLVWIAHGTSRDVSIAGLFSHIPLHRAVALDGKGLAGRGSSDVTLH
jgi:hypothetical protein